MKDILKQIQEATENFNNLFEVDGDGLGNPAGDVPPSTNKIKKSRKTKDGKVELVSVEDELFPEEGNAREQFRQKIINTINGMIQGTATLEDLMQVVRAKQVKPVKEGFEGAIEILEKIINEVSNKTVERALNHAGDKVELSTMGVFPPEKKYVEQYKRLQNLANKRAEKHGEKVEQDPDTGWHKHVKEGFEGAIEILEDLMSAIEKKHGKPEYYSGRSPWQVGREPANKSARLTQKANEIKEKEALQAAERELDKDRPDLKDAHPAKKNYKVADYYGQIMARRNGKAPLKEAQEILEKITQEQHKEAGKKVLDDRKREYLSKYANVLDGADIYGSENVPDGDIKDLDRAEKRYKHAKEVANESFEQAVNILEEIINEVSVGALARAAENNFNKRRDVAKGSTEKSKKAHDSYEKQSKEHPEDEPVLYNALSKLSRIAHNDREKASHANDLVNLNLPKDSKVSANKLFDKADKTYAKRGKEVDKALEKGKGRGDKEFDTPMKKYSRAVDLAVADPVVSRRTNGGTNESFEQAINILETALDAIEKSDYSDEKKKELRSKLAKANQAEREMADAKAWDDWTKGKRRSNHTSIARHETKNSEGERKTRLRSPNNNYRSGGFSKTKPEWKQVEDSIKRHEKKVASESFEQAIGILEEIINEVSIGKLSRALDNSVEKRQKEAQKAKEKAENAPKGSNTAMLNAQAQKAIRRSQDAQVLKSLKLPKDSKVSANKLFKSAEKALPHRENEVTKNSNSSSYSRYRRAWDIADTNPVKYNKSESFEQAVSQIEGLINRLGESKSQAEINSIAAKVLPQREANAKKAHDELNNVTGRISPYSMLNGKLSRKQRETVANALNKAEQAEKKVAHAKNLINNKPKEKEPSGIKFNNVFCSCENPFKEAIDILELFDRPDLVDDVLKVLTKKTMKQHLEAGAKKLLGLNKPKKPANEDFDSSNIKEYNKEHDKSEKGNKGK